jgi:hypothetical protein
LRAGRLRVKAATVVVLATAISAAISSSVAETVQFLELQLDLIGSPGHDGEVGLSGQPRRGPSI